MYNTDYDKENLIKLFIDRYLPRNEISHRLPLSLPLNSFWNELAAERKKIASELPLHDQEGKKFWFVINKTIEEQCDAIALFACRDQVFSGSLFDSVADEALLDEAVWSSVIEGAFTSRKNAAAYIYGKRTPQNKSEQMVQNNYNALTYVLNHLDTPITEQTIIQIAEIVTQSASDVHVVGFRTGNVCVNGPHGPVYTPPEAQKVPDMMRELAEFIRTDELHPVLKACIAHFYLVYIHPFEDGNGRTARALSYMMLLQAGYDFFRYFSISDVVAKERSKYYRSIKNVEESDGDVTYFIDCYSSMLAQALLKMENHLIYHVFAGQKIRELEQRGLLNDRQLKGSKWLLESGLTQVTVENWKKKFKTSTETARRDLLLLSECGVLNRKKEGKKAVFQIVRSSDIGKN